MAEPKPPTLRPPPAPTADESRGALDIWLRVCLRRVHDALAAEPVPEALRRLAAGEPNEPAPSGPPALNANSARAE